MGRQCEMETSWQLCCAKKTGGRYHTIVYIECPIPYVLQFLLYFIAAP